MTNPRFKTVAFQDGETIILRAITLDNDPESASFKDRVDVTSVEVQITDPDRTIDTPFAAMTNIGTGVYERTFATSGKAVGDWKTRFRSTNAGRIAIVDDVFRLEP